MFWLLYCVFFCLFDVRGIAVWHSGVGKGLCFACAVLQAKIARYWWDIVWNYIKNGYLDD